MTSISKNVYIDKLDDIVEKYNTYHRTIKMKPVDVKSSTYILTYISAKMEGPKFKVVDHVRISKYQNIFAKGYVPNWSEEIFVIKKVKNTIPWTYVISDIKCEEIVGMFCVKAIAKNKPKRIQERKSNKKKSQ